MNFEAQYLIYFLTDFDENCFIRKIHQISSRSLNIFQILNQFISRSDSEFSEIVHLSFLRCYKKNNLVSLCMLYMSLRSLSFECSNFSQQLFIIIFKSSPPLANLCMRFRNDRFSPGLADCFKNFIFYHPTIPDSARFQLIPCLLRCFPK